MPIALIPGASFRGTLEGRHLSTVFTSCSWWRARIVPVRDAQVARPSQGALQEAGAPGHSGRLGPGSAFLAYVVYLNFSYYNYLRWFYFILII